MNNNACGDIRLTAYYEHPVHQTSEPILLQIYIVNESSNAMEILNELDSINIPQSVQHVSETVSDADSIHIDFGVSGSATIVQVAPQECVKITLILREEELALLESAKTMTTNVKFRVEKEEGKLQSVLLPATVYKINGVRIN